MFLLVEHKYLGDVRAEPPAGTPGAHGEVKGGRNNCGDPADGTWGATNRDKADSVGGPGGAKETK